MQTNSQLDEESWMPVDIDHGGEIPSGETLERAQQQPTDQVLIGQQQMQQQTQVEEPELPEVDPHLMFDELSAGIRDGTWAGGRVVPAG